MPKLFAQSTIKENNDAAQQTETLKYVIVLQSTCGDINAHVGCRVRLVKILIWSFANTGPNPPNAQYVNVRGNLWSWTTGTLKTAGTEKSEVGCVVDATI
jgi:hypothetical protein